MNESGWVTIRFRRDGVAMHINFDSKSKNEVMAAKLAIDFLLQRHLERETKIEHAAPPKEVIPPPPAVVGGNVSIFPTSEKKPPRPYRPRNRKDVLFERPLSEIERRKYPGLYRLATMVYEWMEPGKLYALSEIYDYMVHTGHPKSSGSGVMTTLVQKGYADRPMKALYRKREKKA